MIPLTHEQQCAVEARGKIVCVDAGAGSGKTRVLIHRILHLIETDGIELNQIAAITFTDKAAGEMKERLRRACREKAPKDDPGKMNFWRRMERQVDMSRICTIHTFCSGILRENALSLGLDPDFAILTEAEADVLQSDVVTSTVHDLLEADDPQTHAAVAEYGTRDFFELLHALLAQRNLADRLLNEDVSAEAIARSWDTRWPEMEETLLRLVCRSRKLRHYIRELDRCGASCCDVTDKREIVRSTLAGFLKQLLHARSASVIRGLIDQINQLKADQGKKVNKVLVNWESEEDYETVKDTLNAAKKLLKDATALDRDPEREKRAAETTAAILHVYAKTAGALRAAKRTRNVLDFDDLISMAAEVLRDTAKGDDSVCARTARGLRHLLIDEFQDTDGVQYEIARLLADAADGPELFIVGDAKQSIYYFRGAEVDVFRQVRQDAGETLPMLGNFRTAPAVLQFVNSFFAASELLEAVESPFHPLVPKRGPMEESQVTFLIPPEIDDALMERYREEEARMIAASLSAIREGACRVVDEQTNALRPARFGDAAILLRSLSNVHLYERALREADIPYTLVAGKGFYERQEVLDLRNLLAFIVDPCDELALVAYLRGPIVALSDDAIVLLAGGIGAPRGVLAGFASDEPLADATQHARLVRARELVRDLRNCSDRPLTEFLQAVFDRTGLEGIVLRQFMGAQRASNLRKAAALAETFSGVRPPNLRAFVRYLDDMAAREIREGEAAPNVDDQHSVTVMTIHKAKGLEFPIVYAADLGRDAKGGPSGAIALHKNAGFAAKVVGDDGTFDAPAMHTAITALRADEEAAEQARILYVAMTRARDHLYLCGKPVTAGGASWMAAFEEQYGVCGMNDGESVSGDDWSAVVRRTVSPLTVSRQGAVERATVDADRIRKRIGAPEVRPAPRTSIPVTEIIKAIHGPAPGAAAKSGAVPKPGVSSAQRGTIMHAFLEQWDWQTAPGKAIESVLRGETLDDNDAGTLRDDMQRIAARLKSTPIGARIANSRALRREVPFALMIDGVIANGKLDLLVDGNTIVDYKTGQPSKAELAVYETQLQLYGAALRELTGAAHPTGVLVLLDCDEDFVREVDLSADAMQRALANARSVLPQQTAPCADG